ncbi:MAG: Ig-like domain-containing protein [Nanoarchaeota archaeon]
MGRTHLAKASIAQLKKHIEESKKRKKYLQEYLHKLHTSYAHNQISYAQYVETLHKKHDKRNIREHIDYYDKHIKHCEYEIKKHRKHIAKHTSLNIFFAIAIVLALTFAFSQLTNIKLTGFFVQEPGAILQEQEYTQEVNLNFDKSADYEWRIENPGILTSLKLYGEIKGQGSVKVYLDDFLILDSSNLKNNPSTTNALILSQIIKKLEEENFSNIAPSDTSTNSTNESSSEEINQSGAPQKEVSPSQEELPSSENITQEGEVKEEETSPSENKSEVPEEKTIFFTGICEETCDLSFFGLNKTSYTLKIEINNATLSIDKIKYKILEAKIPETNITKNITEEDFNVTTTQLPAKINEPVKWVKNIQSKKEGTIKVPLPKDSQNIIFKESGSIKEVSPSQIRATFNETEFSFDAKENNYEIEYETPSPSVIEEEKSNGKTIKVSSPENIHYENVQAFTTLSESLNVKNPSRIKIFWREQNVFIEPSLVEDKDSNGIYDYIEWTIPSLSNQTFDIIVITKAEHLNSNREFISDIYDEVYQLDNLWSKTIPNQDYVRVVFERNLTSSNDITIFPRIINGNPRIEVYEVNKSVLIAEFSSITNNQYNKVYLTNLPGEQDTFDLKIQRGSIEFDHIIDPSNTYLINADALATATGTTSGTQNAGKNILRRDNNGLTAMWINAAGTDPVCSTSATSGATWAALASEAGTETGVAIATNGTGVVYTGMFATNGAGDIAYLYNVAGACDTAGTYADVSTATNDHYRPDVAFDGVNNKYVLCAQDNDDFDIDFAYATPSSTTTLSFTGVDAVNVSGDVTSTSCSVDIDDTGNVFIASAQAAAGVVVYNSSAGTFTSSTAVTSTARTAYSATSVSNMHMSIRGNTILITAEDANSDLVVAWSTDGINYNSEVLAGTVNDPEGCVDENGNFHIAFVNGSGIDYRRRVSNGTWDNLQTITTTGTELYISVRCTNFPANNRMDSNDLELVYTDTGTNIYFANISIDTSAPVNNPPKWFNPVINDSTPDPGQIISHNINWTDDTALSYATLEVNSSGANCDTTSNVTSTTLSGTSSWANLSWQVPNACEGKTIGWRQYANDSLNQWNVTSLQTYTVQNVAPTASFGGNLTDNVDRSNSSATFDLKISDNLGVSYLRLYGNWTGWHANQTNSSPINNSWWNITVTGIPDGIYVWAAWGNDTVNNQAFSTTNRTFKVDSTAPTITLPAYTNGTKYANTQSLTFNISVADAVAGPSLCAINVPGNANQTVAVSNGWCNGTYALTGIADGNKTINAYANDTLGNLALNNSYVVWIDSTAPTITLPAYTNGTQKQNTDTLTLNISVSDSGSGTTGTVCLVDITGTNQTVAYSNGWCNSSSILLTGLSDGNKTIKVYANDSANNFGLNNSFVVDIISQVAPTVSAVEAIAAKNPTDDTTTSITFNFTATDVNGASDINLSTAQAYFQRSGESTRSNTTCINTSIGVGNYINFTCTISMWYYDQNGAWTINATIKDNGALYGENSSTTFTYNVLTAMKMFPTSLAWPEVLIGQTNVGSNNDPIQVNNTGNSDSLNINITSYNLRGEQITTDFILSGNLSVENASQGCSGTSMSNATSLNLTSAILYRGNHSLNYNNATSGQEQLYFCLANVPQGISQQSYSSSAYGSWEVKILLALLIPRRRKKKSIKDDKLTEALGLILDELKEEYSLNKKEITEIVISKLKEKYKISKKEILNTIKSSEETEIPAAIFVKNLGALESLVKYMKENLNINYREISKLLNRNERTIWTAYKKANEKQKEPIKIKETEICIPIEIFKNKKMTILELTIVYLKNKGYKFSEISQLLSRDQRNIWTIHSRALKKLNKNL